MRTYQYTLSIGFHGAEHEDVREFDDKELEGMTEEEIEKYVEEDYLTWRGNYLDGWFRRIDNE